MKSQSYREASHIRNYYDTRVIFLVELMTRNDKLVTDLRERGLEAREEEGGIAYRAGRKHRVKKVLDLRHSYLFTRYAWAEDIGLARGRVRWESERLRAGWRAKEF